MDLSLNGIWKFFVDEQDQGFTEKWFTLSWIVTNLPQAEDIIVPSNFNTLPGLFRYAGYVWYFTKIPQLPLYPTSHDYYIEFEGVNYIADIWLNGQSIGHHEGGFTTFRFSFNPRILSMKTDNWLVVRVDNRIKSDGIPGDNFDWFNWSGIFRNVQINILETTRIRDIKIYSIFEGTQPQSATIHVHYVIKNHLDYLERCVLNGEIPKVEYELYFLGRYVSGVPLSSPILIQTGSRQINTSIESAEELDKVPRDEDSIQEYFADLAQEQSDEFETNLEVFFEDQRIVKKDSVEDPNQTIVIPNSSEKKHTHLIRKQKPEKISSQKKKSLFSLMDHLAITVQNPMLWNPDSPDLYQLTLRLIGIDEDKHKRFGIRRIYPDGNYVYFNNQPIRMYGVNLHEEQDPSGRTYSMIQRRADIQYMKKLGFNALRTAHYPHDKHLLQITDEEGIMVLEEIPLYWNIEFSKRETVKQAASMLFDLISRDFNNPSVIQWSVGNEIPVENYDCDRAVKLLMNWVRKLDPTRLVTYVSSRFCSDTTRQEADVNCINMYFGWYYFTLHQLNFFLDATYHTHPNTPWIMTEFGGDAKYNERNLALRYSEDNQARIISHTIKILNSKPYIAGWFIWVYRDFRSPLRRLAYQNGFNRKGIVSEDNQPKLIARVMPHIIHSKYPNVHHYRALAAFFMYCLRYFELLLLKIGMPIGYRFQKRILARYYQNHREKPSPNDWIK